MKPTLTSPDELLPMQWRLREEIIKDFPNAEEKLTRGDLCRSASLADIAAPHDLILLDAYGVLNLGGTAIPGVPAAVRTLRAQGKTLRVVTNNASQTPTVILSRLLTLGFDFLPEEIITSGMTIRPFVQASLLQGQPYFLMGTDESAQAYAPDPESLMTNAPENPKAKDPSGRWREAEYLLLCSNRDYYGTEQQSCMESLLRERPRPLLVANPDLVAPLGHGVMEVVAGFTAARLHAEFATPMVGLGKPFPPIFHQVMAAFPAIPPEKVLMVGDTLETDILGGLAMGFTTCLVRSGIDIGDDPRERCRQRAIHPDFILPSLGCP